LSGLQHANFDDGVIVAAACRKSEIGFFQRKETVKSFVRRQPERVEAQE
jgi:hypothetical protein